MNCLVRIDASDNVAVALRPLVAGDRDQDITVVTNVPQAHKVACRDIAIGQPVRKYGYVIGVATAQIVAGEHVHSHNLASVLRDDLSNRLFDGSAQPAVPVTRSAETFDGFRRRDGRVGIRNEIWIINTVGCVNHAGQRIAATAAEELSAKGGGIDGIYSFSHPFGCSQLGDDLAHTRQVLAGLARHPNAGAVLILGLGCESNQMKSLLEALDPIDADRVRFFNAQDVGDEIEEGVKAVRELAEYAGQFRREPIPVAELIIGTKCGGSDGLSGITANPLVGRVADRVSAAGGTVLLSEVPEMFGAEDVLLARACSEHIFCDTVNLVNDFCGYLRRHDQPIDENPSPGNKAGGITTLAEKSLGCVQKGGHASVRQVLAYGRPAPSAAGGVVLVESPGNDGVSGTALAVAGAHLILFTTGRGTPMGFPVPTLKISSNTDLARRKPQWIDFDAGSVLESRAGLDVTGEELFRIVLDIASGRRRTKSEVNGYREIAIWKNGVTL